tara:strand:- start:1059 stop:1769 length:711 start_codon:yes stop_codon:yes gene_type:complete
MEDIIKTAMASVASLSDDDKIALKGKAYTMVAQRVQAFRAAAGAQGQILTEVIEQTDQRVMVKASVSVWRDTDGNGWQGGWNLLATDFAEEYRNQGPVNKTSALENCCTSAIGRALSAAGLSGGEYASSFEVDNAIHRKPEAPKKKAAPKKKVEVVVETPAPTPDEAPAKEDDLAIVASGMKEAMKIETTVEGLRSFYTNNGASMRRMLAEEPELHKELVAEMKAYSEKLSTTTTE